MTIRPGEDWGVAGPLAPDAPVATDDAAARRHLQDRFDSLGGHIEGGALQLGEIGLVGGDLHRTLGSPRHTVEELRAGLGRRFPVDIGVVSTGGRELVLLSHLVAHPRRRVRWWAGRTVVAMNAAFIGEMDLGPRAHPNDGRLDITDGSLPPGQRRQGRRRALSGTHLPHPQLATSRVRSTQIEAEHPLHLWLDGTHVGVAATVALRCVPDALTVVV